MTVENSVIGPYVSLAEGCEVRNAIVRDTIVDADAIIENTMLSESLIGNRAAVRGRYHFPRSSRRPSHVRRREIHHQRHGHRRP